MDESEEDEEADEAAAAAEEPEGTKTYEGAPDDKLRLVMGDITCAAAEGSISRVWERGPLAGS